VEGDDPATMHGLMAAAMDLAAANIKRFVTNRQWGIQWTTDDEFLAPAGGVLDAQRTPMSRGVEEYLLTGRHGVVQQL
jgi:phosphoketolase